jgi:low affinity Fe/Cu permease
MILGNVSYEQGGSFMQVILGNQHVVQPASRFGRFAKQAEYVVGHPYTFGVAGTVIIAWAVTGPIFHYSDTWQLVINTATTIITFLMVFLIQNTQNRDSAAIQLKLDELIRSRPGAHNALLNLEELTLEDIKELKAHYETLAFRARCSLNNGVADTGTPEVKLG